MSFDRPTLQTSNAFKSVSSDYTLTRTTYYGEVISIDDPTDGGIIKVKIMELDARIGNNDLADCYPLLPKFFHIYPQVGEVVRIILDDPKYPQKGRLWMGNIISQIHKVGYDSIYSALATTNYAMINPDPAHTTYPDADGVYPKKEDVGLIGRINTDLLLKPNQVMIRAGKHENDNQLKLNIKNPSMLLLSFDKRDDGYYSNSIIMSDKIALISHDGIPKFKSNRLTEEDRKRIFDEGHPIGRGDVIVEALNAIRNAIVNHIHPYSGLPADLDVVINDLQRLNFEKIMQKNIVIN